MCLKINLFKNNILIFEFAIFISIFIAINKIKIMIVKTRKR